MRARFADWSYFAVVCTLMLGACQRTQPDARVQSPETVTGLSGTSWQFVEFESSDDRIGTVKPARPERYTMTLDANGNVSMRLNCNQGRGTWTATPSGENGGSFQFGPLAVTKVYCPPPSMDAQIARDAEYVRTYVLRDGKLYFNLMADAGNYVWQRAP